MSYPSNDAPAVYEADGEELLQFIERFEKLEAEKRELSADQKEVMSEAKSRGYDTKILKKIIAERRRDKDDLAEEQAIMEQYRMVLGMA